MSFLTAASSTSPALGKTSDPVPANSPLSSSETASRFTVAESLFHSSLLTEEKLKLLGLGSLDQYKSIVDCVIDAVQRSDTDLKRDLYFNIILSGGTTLLPGFKERLEKELTERLHGSFRVRVVTTSAGIERRNGVWIGGSILASLGEWMISCLSCFVCVLYYHFRIRRPHRFRRVFPANVAVEAGVHGTWRHHSAQQVPLIIARCIIIS
jgi:hypothetical protein